MKRPIYLLLLFLVAAFSCKKDTLLTYNVPDNIYFSDSLGEQVLDSVNISFAYSDASVQDTQLWVTLAVTGLAKSYDRTYGLVVDPASTAIAGTHFILPDTFVFHAGHIKDTLPIRLLRAKDLQDTTRLLILDLKATKDLATGIPFLYDVFNDTVSAVSFKVTMSDELGAGPYWNSIFATYFGTFSVLKVQLMHQVVGMPLNFWVNLNNLNLGAQAVYFAVTMSRYLKDQAAVGDTVYEADGVTPMAMGAAYQ